MILQYKGKKDEALIFEHIKDCSLVLKGGMKGSASKLIKGDNMEVMNILINKMGLKGQIDLVYIDPPFATSNVFRLSDGKANSISRSTDGIIAYDDSLVGEEYLEFLRERLILLRELLSKKGSIYLHIDYKIGHYVKVLMDEVFGEEHFINDITRTKCNPKNFERRAYGNIKDLILFYSKTDDYIWNEQRIGLTEYDISKRFAKMEKDGRRYTTIPVHAPGETKEGPTGQPWRGVLPPKGRHWRSDPKVLDAFCGSGTTLKAAQELGRDWIGIDKSDAAIESCLKKIKIEEENLFSGGQKYEYLEEVLIEKSETQTF